MASVTRPYATLDSDDYKYKVYVSDVISVWLDHDLPDQKMLNPYLLLLHRLNRHTYNKEGYQTWVSCSDYRKPTPKDIEKVIAYHNLDIRPANSGEEYVFAGFKTVVIPSLYMVQPSECTGLPTLTSYGDKTIF